MKHFALTFLLASAFSTAAIAAPATDKNGWYAGIVLGYSHTNADARNSTGSVVTQSADYGIDSGEFGFVGGYEHDFNSPFFLGAEIEGLASFGEETGLFGQNIDVEKNGSFGLYLKPGYRMSERLSTFLTLGAQWTTYSLINNTARIDNDDTTVGFLYGVGADYMLDSDVSLTAEYNRLENSDLHFQHNPGVASAEVEPQTDIVKLALKYHF